ncbi:MAG: tRNA uridine(34) 5-carboxymethylaminomethyl modification radical SAM/GNAT enzyme Elp3 [Candidatus Aenigmatarchaeota archaeon]
MKSVAKILAEKIRDGSIKTAEQLEKEKLIVSKRMGSGNIIKNSDIAALLPDKYRQLLKIKHVRTASGVANIAVMWMQKGSTCPGKCIYCPQGKGSPKAYTGTEPTTLRALRNNFDPYMQVKNRLKQLHATGHVTDKCELIIMGGTFMFWNRDSRSEFVKRCFDALNDQDSHSLEESQKINESTLHRCIGMTIETRADYCNEDHIKEMLELGCTRVELGVQSTSDEILKKINRMHGTKENVDAIKRLKEAGLKVCVHYMPGLFGLVNSKERMEIEAFRLLFTNPDYRPDELKIYPTAVVAGTQLYKLWKAGSYEPLSNDEATELLIELKKIVPSYVRIKRVMRDISEHEVAAGPKTTNLRQLIKERAACRCIRCREIGITKPKNIELCRFEYDASGGKEIFLSFEDTEQDMILGFLRLRLDGNTAKIRELHVYGETVPIGSSIPSSSQHKGFGSKLLIEAESIAKSAGCNAIQVTSGIGAREYYRKFGYVLDGFYMVKII